MHSGSHCRRCTKRGLVLRASAAVGGCVVVAGGDGGGTADVYEEALGRWRRLPCSLPHDAGFIFMGSALMRRR